MRAHTFTRAFAACPAPGRATSTLTAHGYASRAYRRKHTVRTDRSWRTVPQKPTAAATAATKSHERRPTLVVVSPPSGGSDGGPVAQPLPLLIAPSGPPALKRAESDPLPSAGPASPFEYTPSASPSLPEQPPAPLTSAPPPAPSQPSAQKTAPKARPATRSTPPRAADGHSHQHHQRAATAPQPLATRAIGRSPLGRAPSTSPRLTPGARTSPRAGGVSPRPPSPGLGRPVRNGPLQAAHAPLIIVPPQGGSAAGSVGPNRRPDRSRPSTPDKSGART